MEARCDSLRSPGFVSSQSPAGAPAQGPGPGAGQGCDRQGRRVEIAAPDRFPPLASSRRPGSALEADAKSASTLAVTQRRIDAALGCVFAPEPGAQGLEEPGCPALAGKLLEAVTDCGGTQLSVAATGHLLRSLLPREGLAPHDLRRRLEPRHLVPLGEALARGASGNVMTVVRVDQLARHVRSLAPGLTLEALACLTLGMARAPGKVDGRDDALWAPLARRIAAELDKPQAPADPRWGGLLELADQLRDDLQDAGFPDAQRAHLQARLLHVSGLVEKALTPPKLAPGLDAKHASPATGSSAPALLPFEEFLARHRTSGDGVRTRQASRVLTLSLGGRAMPAPVRNQCLDAWTAAVRALPRQADHQPLVEALCGFVHGALKGPDGSCEALGACIGRMFAGSVPASQALRARWLEDQAVMVLALLKALATPSLDEAALGRFLEALDLPGGLAGTPQGGAQDARRSMSDGEAGFLFAQVVGSLCKAATGAFPADSLLAWLGQAQGPAARLGALCHAMGEALGRQAPDTAQRLSVLEWVLDAPMASLTLRGAVLDGFVRACLDAEAGREQVRQELLAIAPGLGLPRLGSLAAALFGTDPAQDGAEPATGLPSSMDGLFGPGAPAFTAQALRVLGCGVGLALDRVPFPADTGDPRRRAFHLGWRMAQDPVLAWKDDARDGHPDVERWLSWFDDASHVPGYLSPARAAAVLEQLGAWPLPASQRLALVGGFMQRAIGVLDWTALRTARVLMTADLQSMAAAGETPQHRLADGKREASPADAVALLDAEAFSSYVNGLSHLTAMYQALPASRGWTFLDKQRVDARQVAGHRRALQEAADFLRNELAQVEAAGAEKLLAAHLRTALEQLLDMLEQAGVETKARGSGPGHR